MSRLFRRAAVFLWSMPLAAALSIRLMARRSVSSWVSVSAAIAAFARVLISERTARLRTRRFSFWRLRFIWLLMLAMGFLDTRNG